MKKTIFLLSLFWGISFQSFAQQRLFTHIHEDIFPTAMIHVFNETNDQILWKSLSGTLKVYESKDLKTPVKEFQKFISSIEMVLVEDPNYPMEFIDQEIEIMNESWMSFHFVDNYVKIQITAEKYIYVKLQDFYQSINPMWATAWNHLIREAEGAPIDRVLSYELGKVITQRFIEDYYNEVFKGQYPLYENDSLLTPIAHSDAKERITFQETGLRDLGSNEFEEYVIETVYDYNEMAGIYLSLNLKPEASGTSNQYVAIALSFPPFFEERELLISPLAWSPYDYFYQSLSKDSQEILDLMTYFGIMNKLNPEIFKYLKNSIW